MAAKGTNKQQKKNVSSNVQTQKSNSATMAARYSTPSTSASKSTNTSATKNTTSSSLGRAVSGAVKTAANAASSAVNTAKPSTSSGIGSSVTNAIKTATNAVSNSVPAGAGSSSTTSSVNKATSPGTVKYNNTVQETANAQKAARESYVNNLLSQLKNQGGVSGMLNANTNPNMTPSQRTNSMLNTMSGIRGAGLGLGYDPNQATAAKALLQTLANEQEKEQKKTQTANSPYASLFEENLGARPTVDYATLYNPGYTQGANAVTNKDLYNMAGAQDSTLQQALSNAARNALVESVDNPNVNAPFMETPSALVGQAAYDSVVNPLSAVPKDLEGVSTKTSLQQALENAAAQTLNDYGISGNRDVLDNKTTYERVNSALNPGAYQIGTDLLANIVNAAEGDTAGTGSSSRTSSSSYSRTGSGSGLGLGDGSIDISTLYDLLDQRLGEYDANFDEMMNALLDNYNMNFQSLEDAYAAALNRLGSNYSDTEALLNSSLANSQRSLEDERTRALQEAYIARMMQEKNLSDQLDAYGLSGGATESVLADMRNNYNNNRNSIEAKVQESLRDLLQQYMTNLSDARGKYNDSLLGAETNRLNAIQNLANSMSQAENNIINQRSNARAGAYEDLYNTLANLTMKGINYV